MLSDFVTVNGVVHPYNFAKEKLLPGADRLAKVIYEHHRMWGGPSEYILDEDVFLSDFDLDAFSHALFSESQVDVAIIHSLPGQGIIRDEPVMVDRMARLRDKYANRYYLYGTVMSVELDEAIPHLRQQVNELDIVGIKIYPTIHNHGLAWAMRLDTQDFMFPLVEEMLSLGIHNLAVHKAISIGHSSFDPYRLDDVEAVAARFPEMNFHIVHAGLNFLEETCLLLHRFANVYANLEIPWSFVIDRPGLFAEILGELLYWGSPEQVIYGDGCNLVHPRPALEEFLDFSMPDSLIEERGYLPIGHREKELILGGNIARLHGWDLSVLRASVQHDDFEREKQNMLAPPWSGFAERPTGPEIGHG